MKNRESFKKSAGKHPVLKKVLIICAVLAMLGVLAVLAINLIVKGSSEEFIITAEQAADMDADCIIVLGAMVYGNGSMSTILQDRVDCGIELFEAGVSERLLMSGDHGRNGYDEVGTMKEYAVGAGIEPDCVFEDHAGFDTYSSMYRAKEVFCAKKVIIVTQEFHIYRAIYLARSMGLEAYGVICDRHDYAYRVRNELRESLARVKDFFTAIFKPEPDYLGDAIPIWGPGSATDDGDTEYAGAAGRYKRYLRYGIHGA